MQESIQNLFQIKGDLLAVLPELMLCITLLLVVIADLIFTDRKYLLLSIGILGLLLSFNFSINQYIDNKESISAFSNLIKVDSTAGFWKMLFSATSILVVLMSFAGNIKRLAEYLVLILSILIGASFLVMSSNLLLMYFSIEVISISSYIITVFTFDKRSAEAGMKYFLFGAAASATMIYGISLLFIQCGTLDFTSQQFVDVLLTADRLSLILASVLILSGLLFKIAAAPLHIWAPDVYNSAPTPVVALFSVVPKIAGIAILIKLVLALNLFGQSPVNWMVLLSILSMLTLTVGNFSALWQINFKRLMAFSSIAQTGFLLVGLVAFSETGLSNLMFYTVAYALANIGVFVIIQFFERNHEMDNVEDYSGLIKHYPVLGVILLIFLISLTGLPPTVGFTGKLLIFSALWDSYGYTANNWQLYLILFGLLNTVVSLFYYLKVPYYMIFKSSKMTIDKSQIKFGMENYLSVILVLAVLILFFKPDWLMGLINNISFAF